MSFIPAGSLAFSGFGAAPIKFHAPDGTTLVVPASTPSTPPNCNGLLAFSALSYVACIAVYADGPNSGVRVFASDFSTLIDFPISSSPSPLDSDATRSIARDNSGHFYGGGGGEPGNIYQYDPHGFVTGWSGLNLHGGLTSNIPIIAVNGAGTIAYYAPFISTGTHRPTSVYAWSLAGSGSDLGLFASESGFDLLGFNSLLALGNGEVLIGWEKSSTPGFVKHYSAAGALLHTYTLAGTNAAPSVLTPGITDTSFWVSYYDASVTTASGVRIVEIRIADGAILHSFTPDDGAGFEYDGPFTVITADIGTPVSGPPPDPKPPIPTVTCIPSVTVLSSPAVAAGCNQGGTGWKPFYLGASGTVPVAADPDDGEPLTGKRSVHVWYEHTHTTYPSHDIETMRYAMTDLDDTLRKEGRVLAFGDIEHGLSDAAGNLIGSTIDVTISDVAGRPIGTRLADSTRKFFQRDELVVLALSDHGRKTGSTPRRLGRVLVQDAQYGTPVQAKFSGTDHFFIDGGSFGPDRQFPSWKIPTYYVNAPPDVYSKALPVIIGEVSDEGAIDPVSNLPSSRGMCPLRFVGMDGLATGPGGTAELWGRFNLCAFAVFKIISLYASNLGGGLYGRANATSDGAAESVITLGGSPDLSSVPVPATPSDIGITITLYTAKGRQASEIKAVNVGAFQVTVKNQIATADATDVDWIIDEAQPDRTRIDIAARNGQDVMVPGYPNYVRPTPYEDIMGPDGEVYRVTDIWLRGPLLDDVLAGIVTPAANVVGVEDSGDGTGLPLTDFFVAKNWFDENIVVRNSKMPNGPGQLWPQTDGDLATYADGTPIVRGSSYVAAQARTVTAFGASGLQVSAYFGDQMALRDAEQLWNDNGWGRTGTNEHGQLLVLKLNLYDDPSTFQRVEHVSRIFGPVTMTNPQAEIENVVQGTCDWDPDFARYRNKLVERKDDDAIDHNKNMRKPSKVIDGKLTRDPLQFQFILDERLTYAKDGPTYYTFQGDMGLVDYRIGSGILLTSIMGPGSAGVVDLPMIVLKKHVALDQHLVTMTCLAPTFLTPPDLDYITEHTMATGIALALQGCMVRNLYWGGDNVNGFDSASVWDAFNQGDGVEIDNTSNQISGLSGVVVQVRVKLRVSDASINVTPRIYNVTDAAVATTSGAAACSAIATDFSGSNQKQTLALTLANGKKKYKLQLVPSGGGHQAWASGVLSDIYVP